MVSDVFSSILGLIKENERFLESALPFLLIFVMVFAVLQKTKIIGEGRRQFNTIVALALSLMVILPHLTGSYPPGKDVVEIMNTALPQVSLLIIVILSALLLVGVFAPGIMFGGTSAGVFLGLVSIAAVIYIFGNAAGFWQAGGWLSFLGDPDTQAVIVIITVFALIIWFITREDGSGSGLMGFFGKIMEEMKTKNFRP